MYIYEKYSFRIFSLLMALIAFIFVMNTLYVVAAIALVLGIMLSFSYQGIKIDRQNSCYLKYDRFLWWKIGRWEQLSDPSYVTVVRINLSSRRIVPSPIVMPEARKTSKAYKVNLVVEGDERYVSICRGTLEEMTAEALRLGKHMDIRVLDFTTHEKKWIL